MTGTPNYDDILNSNLSREQKAQAIRERGAAYDKSVDKNKWKNIGRAFAGSLVSGTSFHPVLNIPYVGTGIGGALYDLGQGIAEGDKLPELAKRTGRGFVIGETVGAVPYVGKAASKTKVGQAVGNSAPVKAVGEGITKAGEKFANSKLYDALMTDVRAFNPNKQTAYHGSPYDFKKFSNEAIGTGEGAQAHGVGHYTALNKNVADNRYRKRLTTSSKEEVSIDNKYKPLYEEAEKKYDNLLNNLYKQKQNGEITEEVYQNAIDNSKEAVEVDNILSAWQNEVASLKGKKLTPNEGQLYKLSIPKDDVMLREGASFENQPELVQKGLNNIKKDYLKSKGYNSIDDINAELDSLSNQYENIVKNESPYDFYAGTKKSEIQAKISQLENLRRFNETPDLYNYLLNHQHLEPHEVSDLLYRQGIKGISYNGGIDGEAAVIFNPDDIVIGRKYYNQPNLYEQLTGKQNTGALVDALLNR